MVYFCKVTEEGDAYTVEFPDLPHVITLGRTVDEALFNAWEALNGSLESDVAHGFALPVSTIADGEGYFPVAVEPHILVAAELRRVRGTNTQSDIAKRLGMTYQAYQRLENPSKGNPSIKTLERVARAFGKRLDVSFV